MLHSIFFMLLEKERQEKTLMVAKLTKNVKRITLVHNQMSTERNIHLDKRYKVKIFLAYPLI